MVAADLITGDEVAITRGGIVDAVRASIAIPGVFPPVRSGDMLLVDGGVIAPVPVRAVRALSKAPVLAINLQGDYRRRAQAGLPAGKKVLTPFRIGRAGLSLLMAHVAKQSLAIDPPGLETVEHPLHHADEEWHVVGEPLDHVVAAHHHAADRLWQNRNAGPPPPGHANDWNARHPG